MMPTKPGEWWWCEFDRVRWMALIGKERRHGEPVAYLVGYTGPVQLDDPRIVWLGPVPPFAASPDPAAPDASDEVRLAAGWRQEVRQVKYGHGAPPLNDDCAAPGPAGLWRLHASGLWVRWVVAS